MRVERCVRGNTTFGCLQGFRERFDARQQKIWIPVCAGMTSFFVMPAEAGIRKTV